MAVKSIKAGKPIKAVKTATASTSVTRSRALGLLSALGRGRAGVKIVSPGGERHVQIIPSGVDSIDVAIGAGGYPISRLTILHGGESTGKTTCALQFCAEVQQRGGVAIYADCEHKLDLAYAEHLGVDVESLVRMFPDSIEQCFKKLSKILRILRGLPPKKVKQARQFGAPDPNAAEDDDEGDGPIDEASMEGLAGFDFPIVFVLDSFQSLVAQRTFEAEYDKEGFNPESSAWARSLAKFMPEADDLQVVFLGISQVRMDLAASGFGPKKEKVGVGKAPVHHATIVLRWTGRRKAGSTKKGITGELHEVLVAKNQIGNPYRVASVPIVFGEGVDKVLATYTAAQATGVLAKQGARYVLSLAGDPRDGKPMPGVEALREIADRDPELFALIRSEIRARMGSASVRTVAKEDAEIESLDEA